MRLSKRDPSTMSPSAINAELDRLEKLDSGFTDEMISAGRGYERFSEWSVATDELAKKGQLIFERERSLRNEIARRYGPNPPSRLPTRK
jgi:hypothetical protein